MKSREQYFKIFNGEEPEIGWHNFFLLNADAFELQDRVRSSQQKDGILFTLIDHAIEAILMRSDVSFINASHTLTTVCQTVAERSEMDKHTASTIFSPEALLKLPALARRYSTIIAHSTKNALKSCAWSTLLKIATLRPDVSSNWLLLIFCCQDILEAILIQFLPSKRIDEHANCALNLFPLLLCHFDGSALILPYFATLEDSRILGGLCSEFRHFLIGYNFSSMEHNSRRSTVDNSIIERFSNAMSLLFRGDGSDSRVDILEISQLFLFFTLFTANRKLKQLTFVIPPATLQTDHTSPPSSVFGLFLTYASFIFTNIKEDAARLRAKLCMLIILSLLDDPEVQNYIHETAQLESVVIFRPGRLHRPAQLNFSPPATILASAILELQTEFITTNLSVSIPLEFLDFALGSIHRVLAAHKQKQRRLENWKPLFSAILCLTRFILSNEHKLPYIEPLILRLVMLINFFVLFGDQFLDSAEAYENIYYEILRQQETFNRLDRNVKAKPSSSMTEKINAQLANIMNILSTINSHLTLLDFPTEDQVFDAIRRSFDSLELRMFPNLATVEKYDTFVIQRTFFELLAIKLCGKIKGVIAEDDWF